MPPFFSKSSTASNFQDISTPMSREMQIPERALDSPEAELQVVMSRLTWVLGTELRSSERAADSLNHSATPLAA